MRSRDPYVIALLLAGWATSAAIAQVVQLKPEALAQVAVLQQEKASRTPAQQKIDSHLLLALKRQRDDPLFRALPELRPGVEVAEDGTVLVDIKAEVSEGLLQEIAARGGTVVNSHVRYRAIRASFPLVELESLAASPAITFIRPASIAVTNKVNTSEGDVAHAANLARSVLGVDGSGIKACVLSDGIDTLLARIATGDLPSPTFFLVGQTGSGDEGTAMLEIVYDLAPGADLIFATGSSGEAQMAQNILDLRVNGCDSIVDDVTYFTEPVFQDGIIAQAVNSVVVDGAIYFSSAANSGNLNDGESGVWEGDYSDGDHDRWHNFSGVIHLNTITTGSTRYTLQWSDPQGGADEDYDLYLFNAAGNAVLASSTNRQTGTEDPYESIPGLGAPDVGHHLAVWRFSGSPRFLHLNSHRGRLTFGTDGSTFGHNAAAAAFGVAAVDVAQASGSVFDGTESVETFSSDGPRRIFFYPDGTPITPGDFLSTGGALLQKPDIAAADKVSTSTPGFETFPGTSAAAPHAAAIAALMLEESALTQDGMEAVFAATSLDIEAPGVDRDSGYGIIHARDVVGTVTQMTPDCYVNDLEVWGIPNSGPATFRACQTITWGPGTFNNVSGIAETHIFTDGFESGDVSAWSNAVP